MGLTIKERRDVVLDTSALIEGYQHYIQDTDRIVLLHTLAAELLGGKRSQKIETLLQWLSRNPSRWCLAFDPVMMTEVERLTEIPITGSEWHDLEGTRRLFDQVKMAPTGEVHLSSSGMRYLEAVPRSKNHFVEYCKELAKGFPNMLDSDGFEVVKANKYHELIKGSYFGTIGPRLANSIFHKAEWIERLDVFPDVFALGKLSRICVWYAMAYAAGVTKRFENNYEDAQFAFMASYTGFLATSDGRLKDMTRAIFPHVSVVERTIASA